MAGIDCRCGHPRARRSQEIFPDYVAGYDISIEDILSLIFMTLTMRRPFDLLDVMELPYPLQEDDIVRQVAALPYRFDEDGNVEVMLITSRGGQRWIPPKGNLMKGRAPHEAAAEEAYEEAGVIGRVSTIPLGIFKAVKLHGDGSRDPLDVTLFPLLFDRRADDWPERGQRTAAWFAPDGAARLVREPDLAHLITRFHPAPAGARPTGI